MPSAWTGEVVGLMHINRISNQMLAAEMGVTDRYLSMILNGHKSPADAERKIKSALQRLIEKTDAKSPAESPRQ